MNEYKCTERTPRSKGGEMKAQSEMTGKNNTEKNAIL